MGYLLTFGIFTDLKKAFDSFDTVDHAILLQKLDHYGIRGIITDWFSSHLLGRSQVTEVDTYLSSKSQISCGVPQFARLRVRPVVILDLHQWYNSSDKFSFYLFADDSNLLYADKNLKSLEENVNNELLKVSEWLNANKLTLNSKKSNYVIFRPYQLGYSVDILITAPILSSLLLNELKNLWTGKCMNPERKSYGFKNIRMLVDGAYIQRNRFSKASQPQNYIQM